VHYVPDDNIVHLENRKATRAAILSAFKSHFLNNEQIRDDGEAIIIFFFSGHGSRVEATGDRIATDGKVEVICPVDERTTKESYGIPDYTLGRLFQKVADLKKPLNIVRCFPTGSKPYN
jgi:hypothetical protein